MADELEAEQGLPEGETAPNPGNTPEPEQDAEAEGNQPEAEGNDDAEEGAPDGDQPEASAEQDEGESDQPKPDKKKQSWELRRIDELTKKRREAERRAEELAAKLARYEGGDKPEPSPDNETDLDRIRREERDRIRAEEYQRVEQERMNSRVQAWDSAGQKEFGKETFWEKCNTLAAMGVNEIPVFMNLVTDPEVVKDGHKVIVELADNPEEVERIASLSPVRMAIELAKIGERLSKPTPRPISKAPAPVTPVGGQRQVGTRLDDENTPMDKWADEYLKSLAKKAR